MSADRDAEAWALTAAPNQAYHAAERADPGCGRHHVLSRAWKFAAPVDPDRLRSAYLDVCNTHQLLRASFGAGGRTYVISPRPPRVSVDDDSMVLSSDSAQVEPFDGHSVELMIGPQTVRLSVSHAVCDRRSFELTVAELSKAYAGQALEPEEAPYHEYVTWLDSRRTKALAGDRLGHRLAMLQTAGWPPRHERRPTLPSKFSTAVRHGCRTTKVFEAGCLSQGMTVTAAALEASGAALSSMVRDLPVIAGVPLALRPGRRFHKTIGDYTNTGLVLLPTKVQHLEGQSSRLVMKELAAAIEFDALHVLELSRLMGDHDAARIRIDVDTDRRQALTLDGNVGSEVIERAAESTRRDLSVALRLTDERASVLCALKAGAAVIDIERLADRIATHLEPYGF